MSLSRLALRLAAVEALRPSAALLADGPWPTLAGKYVFDSRIDPIEDLKPGEARPIICVYTDDDDAVPAQKRGGPPYLVTVDLVLETSVVVSASSGNDPSVLVVGEPETDAELEAALDCLGAQIAFALLYAPEGAIFRRVCGSRVLAPKSAVHRTSEEAVRLARRTVTWKVEINSESYDPAPAQWATGLHVLPEPLRAVAAALPENSYARRVLAGLAGERTMPRMPLRVPLQTVGLNARVASPSGVIPQAPNIVGEVDNLSEQTG